MFDLATRALALRNCREWGTLIIIRKVSLDSGCSWQCTNAPPRLILLTSPSIGPWAVNIVTGQVTSTLGNWRLSSPTENSFCTAGHLNEVPGPDYSRIGCSDRGYDLPSGRPRALNPATYCASTPRIQAPAVARWHAHLHGLATQIHE